jgi:hypothetical protein
MNQQLSKTEQYPKEYFLANLFFFLKKIKQSKTEQYPKEYFLATLEKTKRGVLTETIEQPFVQV